MNGTMRRIRLLLVDDSPTDLGILSHPLAVAPEPAAAGSPRLPGRIEPPPVRPRLVAIGASTGGPQTLGRILGLLPKDFPLPIVCVQHISRGFLEGMLEWLRGQCPLPVEQAGPGTTPQPGRVYFAPEGRHLILAAGKRFASTPCTPGDLHCPGVDRLLTSVAQCCGPAAVGVLLSGMGRDGADGLKAMREAGAPTIVQDESSSVVFGMPAAAIALDAARYVLPTEAIAAALVRLAG